MKIPHRIIYEGGKVGRGASQPSYGLLNVIVKHSDNKRRFMVSNEIVALGFAQYLHLPVPPGGVVMNRAGTQPRFFSLEIFPDGPKPTPHADPAVIADKFTALCWGITLFDALLINKDRRPGNLAYDEKFDAIAIFDHGNCLFGTPGRQKIRNHVDLIGTGDHCLEKNLKRATGYKGWIEAIRDIPDAFIRNTVARGEGVGYSRDDCQFISEQLISRKARLHEFVLKQIEKFASLPPAERKKIQELTF
ncbi:hypothetical protein [Novipirellula caenicola]|uniref:Phosphatidylinositol 3-and 4-kinase n=1 Tax=Novipirellula caenicola TaxID=1536901 RepID=A0ABP9W339_9BACT